MDRQTLARMLSQHIETLDPDSISAADWDALPGMAQGEGVGPLLYWKLSKSGKFSSIPEAARNALRAQYSSTWMQNQRLLKELESLTHLFSQADIPVVALKGACFALTIYTDSGLRPMGDLDLLVPGASLAQAVKIARGLGYVDSGPEAAPGLRELLNHEVCLQKKEPYPVTLELHRSLVADRSFVYAVPVDWFWGQTQALQGPANAKYEDLRMLTPEAQLLYAAAHAMLQHGGWDAPLRWFYDLDLLLRFYGERLEWDVVLEQARRFEWGSALAAALAQTQALFDTPIPAQVQASLAGLADRHTKLVQRLQTAPATHVLEERQKMLTLNGYARFRLLLALIVPGPAYMRWRYRLKTSWLIPLYYPLRWWGILADAVRTMWVIVMK